MAVEKYPGKRYHADGRTCYVQNADEDAALGSGWYDSPKKAAAAKAKPAKASEAEK